jgi:hypothetical protein
VFWIMRNPNSLKSITLLLESIPKVPLQAWTGYVRISGWGQHSSNHEMPCLDCICDTIRHTWNQPNHEPGAVNRCIANIILNTTNREILWPGMLNSCKIGQVSCVECTNDWHNHQYSRKLILQIPPPVPTMAKVQIDFRLSYAYTCSS